MAKDTTAPETDTAQPEAPASLFTFQEEETPKTSRAKKFNPFIEAVGHLVPGSGKGLGFDVPAGEKLGPIRSQLDAAGLAQDPPVSVHWKVTPAGAKVGPAHVHISTTAKIVQKKGDGATEGTDAQS